MTQSHIGPRQTYDKVRICDYIATRRLKQIVLETSLEELLKKKVLWIKISVTLVYICWLNFKNWFLPNIGHH